jgi:hypothetical protein
MVGALVLTVAVGLQIEKERQVLVSTTTVATIRRNARCLLVTITVGSRRNARCLLVTITVGSRRNARSGV